MVNGSARGNPETLFTLLFVGNPDRHDGKASPPSLGLELTSKPLKPSIPVASTNKHRIWESDSDDEEVPSPSLDLVPTSKPSKSSLPIILKEPTASDVMKDTHFDNILDTITAGLLTAGTVTFRDKIVEMFWWSSPYNDYVKITDFYIECDQKLWECAREKGKLMPAILTIVIITKLVGFMVLLLTIRSEARKNSLSQSTKSFMRTFMNFASAINKMFKNPLFQSVAYGIAVQSIQYIYENPQTSDPISIWDIRNINGISI